MRILQFVSGSRIMKGDLGVVLRWLGGGLGEKRARRTNTRGNSTMGKLTAESD